MRRITSISSFFFMIFCLSCSKENKLCFSPPTPVLLRLIDNNGNDLLNPANINSYKKNDISLSYIDNGTKTYSTVAINSFPNTDTFFLSTEMGWLADKGRVFYLKLSPVDTDTIYLRDDKVTDDDCTYYSLSEFKYNDTPYSQKGIVAGQPAVFEIKK